MINIYLLYGPPGVGKGSISEKLPPEHCLGIGSVLRKNQVGIDGNLIPDEYVNQLVKEAICAKKGYVILDGYPRTMGQVEYIKNLPNVNIVRVYSLVCQDKILMDRLSLRQTCVCGATYHPIIKAPKKKDHCDLCGKLLFRRADDAPEIVLKRLKQFHEVTEPILKSFGKLVRVIDVEHNFKEAILSVANEIINEQKKYNNSFINNRITDNWHIHEL